MKSFLRILTILVVSASSFLAGNSLAHATANVGAFVNIAAFAVACLVFAILQATTE